MVYDFLANWCGRQFVETLPESSYHRTSHPSPGEVPYSDTAASYINAIYTPGTYAPPASSMSHHPSSSSSMIP